MMNLALLRYRLNRFAELSEREQNVARLFVECGSRKEVARLLFIEDHTVRCHLATIYRKLGIGGNQDHRPGMELAYTLAWADGYAAAVEDKWAVA
jgi:DNA-binding NarL/FixJ family response regulator